MQHVRIFSHWLVTFLLLSTLGCQEKGKQEREDLLKKPPYLAITDSLRAAPDRPDLYLARALLLSQNNYHEWATADYKQAWALTPDEHCGMELSANLMLVNDTLGAIAILQECRQQFPGNESFYKRLSEIFAMTGKQKEAIAMYDTLLMHNASDFVNWFEKGLLLLAQQDTVGAQQALEQSYALQPTTNTALALANILSMRKDPRVLDLCDALLAKDSAFSLTEAVYLKGIYFSDTKQYQKAIESFNRCINNDWTFIDAHLEKGMVYFEQKKWQDALATFETAVKVSNTNADAYYWRGRSHEALQQPEAARENYLIALSLDPSFREASAHLALLNKANPAGN